MATEVASLEAVLDAKIGGFMRSMDAAEKRMQGVETKAKSMTESIQSVGIKLAAVGAGIAAAFGMGMKEAEKETQALNRMRAMVQSVGGDWEAMKGQIMPTLQTMEELTGVPVEDLVQQFGHLYQKSSDVGRSMKVLEMASGLASQGIGDVASNSEAMINALTSGDPMQLLRMDRSLAGIAKKWNDQTKEIGAAAAKAGLVAEIFDVLAKRSGTLAERSPWQQLTYQMGELHKEIGGVVNNALAPLYLKLVAVIHVVREFTDTTLGKWIIGIAAAFTVIVTLGGGLIVLIGQVTSAARALGGFGSILGRLGGGLSAIGTSLLWVVGLLMAFELGLRIGNALMQWDAFRNLLTRVNGLIGFLIEKVKGFFGHENASLMQTYWMMATGALVTEKPTKGVSLLGKIGEKLDELKAKLKGVKPEIDTSAFALGDFGASAGDAGAAGEVKELDIALEDAVGTFQKWQDAMSRSRLQRGQKMGVLSDLLDQQASLQKITNPSPEQIDAMTNLQTQITDLSGQIEEDLRSPWQKAKDSVVEFGGFATDTMGMIRNFAGGLADVISNGIGQGFANAKKSLGEFFAQFMRQIAAMILQAVILAAIMSFLPGGGGFIGNLKGLFGMKAAPAVAGAGIPEVGGTQGSISGSSLADSFLAGIQSRGSAISDLASAGSMDGTGLARSSFNVVVHEATRRTWVEITDREIEPRLLEREKMRTVRT